MDVHMPLDITTSKMLATISKPYLIYQLLSSWWKKICGNCEIFQKYCSVKNRYIHTYINTYKILWVLPILRKRQKSNQRPV